MTSSNPGSKSRRGLATFGRLQLTAICILRAAVPCVNAQYPLTASEPSTSTITHHSARVNGVKYHYALSGSGPAVVLLHGWPVTWLHWHRIIPHLSKQYTVIAPDLRGLGSTERPESGYDERTVAEDIYQLVRHLGHQRINLVGHDVGGMVAFALAHEHPHTVHKLVILDAPLPGLGAWEQSQRRLWHLAFHQVPDLPEALVAANVRTYLQHFLTFTACDPTAIDEAELSEYVRAYSQPGALRAGFAYYRAFGEDTKANQQYALKRLPMPVLALGGALTMGEGVLRQLQPIADNVQGGVLPNAGHWFASEKPEELARRLLDFFSQGSADSNVPGNNIQEPGGALSSNQRLGTWKLNSIVVDDTMTRPNGLTLTLDERTLIVADTIDHDLIAFDVQPNGTLANRRP
jgi:pimeloyl-ACP methyl ester carboxylesterase